MHDILDKTITYDDICNLNITYDMMRLCTNKLKKQKDDGDIGHKKPLTAIAPETRKNADRDSTRNTKSCYTR